jgi:hypothetical protein
MLPFDQAEYPDQDKGRMMELPMVAPAPGVRDHAVICRAQVDHHGQCRHVHTPCIWSTLLGFRQTHY